MEVFWGRASRMVVVVCVLFLSSCNIVLFRIEGQVVDLNGEPLPGVCVTSQQTSDYAITDAMGKFYFTLRKPVTKLKFLKSDYLPVEIEIPHFKNNRVDVGRITLTLKPFLTGVYYYDKSLRRYVMLSFSQAKRLKLDDNNLFPSLELNDIVQVKVSPLILYIYRMPYYDIKMYRLKLVDVRASGIDGDKSGDKSKVEAGKAENTQVLVPDRPVIVHTRFLSPIDNSLFILEPLDNLDEGYYCINWGAFETPYPKIVDNYLFRVVKDESVKQNHN